MFEITQSTFQIGAFLLAVTVLLQIVMALYVSGTMRIASRERNALNKEMFGLLKKLEGLTSTRREQTLRHYDKLLETLTHRLPPIVASHASDTISEMEAKILQRLAELEPNLEDSVSRQKMDGLIKTMEHLEQTLVALTADTVQQVLSEGRRSLLDDNSYADFEH